MVTFLQQMILNRMNKSDDSPAQDEKKFAAAKKVNPKLSAS
jgi:hypothetical protein